MGLPPGIFFPNSGGLTNNSDDSNSSGWDWTDVFGAAAQAAQIYTNYDLAKRAENAQRPTTFQTGANGSPVVTGGGAPNLGLTGQNSIFGTRGIGGALTGSTLLIVMVIVFVLILVLKK